MLLTKVPQIKTQANNTPSKLGMYSSDSRADLLSRKVSPGSGNSQQLRGGGLSKIPSQSSITSGSIVLRPNNKIERQIESVHSN